MLSGSRWIIKPPAAIPVIGLLSSYLLRSQHSDAQGTCVVLALDRQVPEQAKVHTVYPWW